MTRPHEVDRRQQVSGETGNDQQYGGSEREGDHPYVRFIGRRAAGLGRGGLQGFCILVVLLQTLAAAPAEFAVYQLVLERRFPRVSHPAGGRTWSGPDRGR